MHSLLYPNHFPRQKHGMNKTDKSLIPMAQAPNEEVRSLQHLT